MRIAASWYQVLKHELEKPYVQKLKNFLNEEEQNGVTIYPPPHQIFNAFLHTPIATVKVVIMGQDPYHGKGQAEGLCFSVAEGTSLPPSLRNIFLELENDLGIKRGLKGSLASWAAQGVLLLNATLTVRAGSPASHYGMGWEQFTDAVIQTLSERHDPIIFVLWGKFAQEKCAHLLTRKESPHILLKAPHPSPFSAHQGFFGCRHFSKINTLLKSFGKTPIDWSA
jgi:uracil-DNA glycosylase